MEITDTYNFALNVSVHITEPNTVISLASISLNVEFCTIAVPELYIADPKNALELTKVTLVTVSLPVEVT